MKKCLFILSFIAVLVLSGCGQNEAGYMDYDQTKKMLVDILKTDDGKKAVEELLADEKIKQQLVMDQGMVRDTIETTLTSEKGSEFWKKSFDDPKFAESMAKSMKNENEQLLKDLMKDPEYQKMMMEVMKDPEMEKEITNLMKSQEYREHLKTVITETFESPLFKAKLQDILLKAAEEAGKGSGGGGGGEGGGQESGSGEEEATGGGQ
ncbi:spore germination protein D [Cytobacillus horneckiae]|uniref:Spore gernimation protein GerD n=1 Tax=Cytobacillus horneckiae TaxID=549687 RepID=A0A2N0Z8G6_9BACI|nr:spore germination lipoprotein GerD [Cytobacillus horneckiae]MBN6889712.1 spore gernimation protein GerD [Cytobacillus horneckiae]MEC1155891.1 spore germination lipoprotein GerD [Cytobacillus horneckiae]MED2940807.1 spore germination lipoprotein GerD [Cytobacillus horneckiae]PKG25803.1 spore gernimation protein GerD [Cytobacillus horneckiae]